MDLFQLTRCVGTHTELGCLSLILLCPAEGKGGRTRVLMLSATSVNNRFRDLQNQLGLAYRGNNQDWQEALGLRNDVRATFRNAQSVYGRWSKLEPEERTTKALMGMLRKGNVAGSGR